MSQLFFRNQTKVFAGWAAALLLGAGWTALGGERSVSPPRGVLCDVRYPAPDGNANGRVVRDAFRADLRRNLISIAPPPGAPSGTPNTVYVVLHARREPKNGFAVQAIGRSGRFIRLLELDFLRATNSDGTERSGSGGTMRIGDLFGGDRDWFELGKYGTVEVTRCEGLARFEAD